jgi:hypothetical protein
MSKKTMSRVLAELKSIRSHDMWVQDSINICIALIEAEMKGKGGVLPPHQSHSDTSTSAALSIAPKFGTMTRDVLVNLTKYPSGLTDEEAQNIMGMQGNSYRPCRVTLMDRGFVADTGDRRKTNQRKDAVVWTVTLAGYKSLEIA